MSKLSVISRITYVWLLGLATASVCLALPFDGRIVGGWETTIAHFPHQVSLRLLNTPICGGSIISNTLILTAAHCVARYNNPRLYSIRAGSTYSKQGGVLIPVIAIRKHEQYAGTTNDIAILKTLQPITFSTDIKPITILEKDYILKDNEQFWVSGWGSQHSKFPTTSPILRYTSVNHIPLEQCKEAYGHKVDIDENMLCAGVAEGGRDSCQGDSGGPLIASIDNMPRLVGIVSFGLGCGEAKYPGVYCRVQNYHDWLNKTINELN